MPDDFNAQLASHEDIIRHLVALCTRMDTVIDALREDHRLIVQLLQRRADDDHRNGGPHA
jgi:hypothetical protein